MVELGATFLHLSPWFMLVGDMAAWPVGDEHAGSLGLEAVRRPNPSTIYLNGPLVSAGARWRFGR